MKLFKHIPNGITSLNLLSGSIAVALSFYAEFEAALLCMIASAIFDFFDGFAARLLKAHSPIGKELDSLADMISFGLAPAFIATNKLLQIWGMTFIEVFESGEVLYIISILATLLIAVLSALRLAKFNIDTRQSENFIGLATPSNALLVGSLIYALSVYPAAGSFISANWPLIPIISLLLALLLVSEIPMFSFKFKSLNLKENANRIIFIGITAILGIVILAIGANWSIWIASIFTTYIVVNILFYISSLICNKK